MLVGRILRIAGLLLLILLVLLGLNENILQAIGNIAALVPGVGVWYNAISGFTRSTLTDSFEGNLTLALGTLNVCLASNILDSIFLGLLFAILKRVLGVITLGQWSSRLEIGSTIAATIAGVLILMAIKSGDQKVYAIVVAVIDALLLLGGVIVLLRGPVAALSTFFFLFDVSIGAVEAGGSIGLLCSVLLLPSMIRNGVALWAFAVWLLCVFGLVAVLHLVHRAYGYSNAL